MRSLCSHSAVFHTHSQIARMLVALKQPLPLSGKKGCAGASHAPFLPSLERQNRRRSLCPKQAARANISTSAQLATFPADYGEAIKQAQAAVQQALSDGSKLIEVEFPPTSLASVPGDGEGANEMTESLKYLRQFCRILQDQADSIRIFFPDEDEMVLAQRGGEIAPVFGQTKFQLDFLTQPTGLLDLGIDLRKVDVAAKVGPDDQLLIMAYPHFNVNEMIAVAELWEGAAKERGIPIITFNGELDRIRSGYYPPLFYPKLGKLAKEFIPLFETAYYIKNFKGSRGGALFRAYPGPWQVLRRDGFGRELRVVETRENMPSLKEVALEILPRNP